MRFKVLSFFLLSNVLCFADSQQMGQSLITVERDEQCSNYTYDRNDERWIYSPDAQCNYNFGQCVTLAPDGQYYRLSYTFPNPGSPSPQTVACTGGVGTPGACPKLSQLAPFGNTFIDPSEPYDPSNPLLPPRIVCQGYKPVPQGGGANISPIIFEGYETETIPLASPSPVASPMPSPNPSLLESPMPSPMPIFY